AALRRGLRHDAIGAQRLTEAAQVADPDPWRGRLRVALIEVDGARRLGALRTLVRAAPIEELPVASLHLLGQALLSEGDTDLGTDVLRQAQRRYPGDVWVNFDLADVLEKSGRTSEAIPYYTVVRALRPQAGHNLARCLAETGRLDEAIVIFHDLIR